MIASLLLGISLAAAAPQDKKPEPLPIPYVLKREALDQGNPLAQYAEMLRLAPEYLKGVGVYEALAGRPVESSDASNYWQARATIEGNLGAIQRSLATQELGWFASGSERVLTESPLDSMRQVGAVEYLAREADRHRWIILGEEHMKPQTRSILMPLLRELRKRGFTYFAAETFDAKGTDWAAQGYPGWHSGYYTQDPVFAEAVREAIRLGFKLVSYEKAERPPEGPKDDPWFAQNFREHGQAENLKTRIYDRDPKAKVIVWGGRSHAIKTSSKQPDGEFRPMAYEFKRMTGIDPLSVYLPSHVESSRPQFERPEYKYATQKGWVTRPTVFLDRKGRNFELDEDQSVVVFFPRTTYVQGRPDWLVREVGRVLRPIPKALLNAKGMLLAQVWLRGEPVKAVPVDQILIVPGNPAPWIAVPRGRACTLRVIDPDGKVIGTGPVMG